MVQIITFLDWSTCWSYDPNFPGERAKSNGAEIRRLLDEGWEISLQSNNLVTLVRAHEGTTDGRNTRGRYSEYRSFERDNTINAFEVPLFVLVQ